MRYVVWITIVKRGYHINSEPSAKLPLPDYVRVARYSTVVRKKLHNATVLGGALVFHCPTRRTKMLVMFWLSTPVKVLTKPSPEEANPK